MAKTYLEAYSRHTGDGLVTSQRQPNILLMDAGQSVGGTWDATRLYPGLKTNNAISTYELSDFTLVPEKYGLGTAGHIPGHVVHQYLSDVAEHFGITPLIRLSTRVEAAVLQDDGTWLVSYSSTTTTTTDTSSSGDDCSQQRDHGQLVAAKVAVATGLTSEPHVPSFVGQETFKGAVFHARELRSRTRDLAASAGGRNNNVVVIGGNKSAWDACYLYATQQQHQPQQQQQGVVHMVIRPSGGGPSWVWRPGNKIMMGLINLSISRLSATRLLSWLDPSPFGRAYQLPRRFLRRTWLGRRLSSWAWAVLEALALRASGYHQDRDPGVQKLRPWSSAYWMGNSLSVHNYETEWFDLVRSGRVVVHHAEVASLGETVVRLTDGEDVEADTIVCCTGWKNEPTIRFGPPEIVPELGLPAARARVGAVLRGGGKEDDGSSEDDARLVARARRRMLRQCPELLSPPRPLRHHRCHQCPISPANRGRGPSPSPSAPMEGFLLYHFMIPPSERILRLRNLAFLGIHQSVHTTMVAQAQALWATAFFDGLLLPVSADGNINNNLNNNNNKEEDLLRYKAYCEAEYQRLRRPKEGAGAGGRYLDLVFDTLPYVDCLLEEVGVRAKRKGTWWREVFQPYTLRDYRGIVQEWMMLGSSGGFVDTDGRTPNLS